MWKLDSPSQPSPQPAVDWRSSRLKRFEAWAIAALGYPLIAALGATLRWRVEGMEHLDRIIATGRQPVMAFWHGRILPATYYFRRRGIVVMTSENFDGEWIARIIERFGYGAARGSTSRGAQRAMLQMKRAMEAGKPTGFTVDGPRGPLRSVQPGAVWLARATSNPILPFHIEAARSWSLRSWDRTQIPKPFTTLALAIGEPIGVVPEASDGELERRRQELEATLHRLEEKALSMLQNSR
ncbi:MAG: lysophospholipid acyltransferase family protein [Acidobacteria bacterium]|nr:lysophospholipid acyltransferase family protein [Acidobacteriota bacterium]